MGTAGLGLVLGGLFVVGCGCLPWWCRVLCRGACWRVVLRVCPAWPACGARSLPGRAVFQARGHSFSLAGRFGSMAGLLGARLWPGARQWGVCTGGGGLGSSPLAFRALSLCPFSPACPACLPSSYPLGWPGLIVWSWWSDLVFLFCRAAWPGFVLGAGCSCGVPCRVYRVLGLLAPVHRRACPVCGVACAVSWAAWLLFTGVRVLCVVLCVRCPEPPGSCSPVCTLCVWRCVYGVLGLSAPVHLCVRSVCGVACTVSWASRLLFTCVYALCVVLCVRCPGPPGSCSPVCTLCVWCCVYDVLGLLAPAHRRARSVCGVACTVSWASWLLFIGVNALCVVLWVRCLGPLGSCSPACTLCVRCCVRGVPGRLAPVHRCACFGVLCPVYGVLGPLAPVHRCAHSACGVVCVVSWAFWPLFAGVLVWCVLCCVCGVLGHLARVLQCCGVLRCVWCSVCGVAFAVSWASQPLFTGAHIRCVVLCGRCPGPLGSCSPVCLCGVLCGVFGVLGLLAPSHRCACVVCCVVCAVSRATWLPFTGVPVWRVLCCVFGVLGLVAPVHRRAVCLFGVLCVVRGVPGLVAPVHRCACSVCCVVCVVWVLVCARVCHTVLVAFFVAPKSRRRRCIHGSDSVGNAAANSPLAFRPTRRPASYGVLLILPVLDSLFLATPKSKRVLIHAWRCMLFTRWFVYSLYCATCKSRRVCLMHS